MNTSIKVGGIKETMDRLQSSKFAVLKVAAMALNRAADTGKVRTQQIAREEYTMKAGDAKKEIGIEKANMRWLQSRLVISDHTIPLIKFQHKGTGRRVGQAITAASKTRKATGRINPVSVMVKRSGGYKQISRAFKARGRYGEDIFVRTSRKRFPLKSLRGPSMAGIVKDTVRTRDIEAVMRKRFESEFKRGLQYAIDKGRIKTDDSD